MHADFTEFAWLDAIGDHRLHVYLAGGPTVVVAEHVDREVLPGRKESHRVEFHLANLMFEYFFTPVTSSPTHGGRAIGKSSQGISTSATARLCPKK